MPETQFTAFFIVLLVAVLFSTFFRKFHLPWSVTLIIGGIFAGPNLLGWIETNETLTFMAEIGAVFLMFMAGLETPVSAFKKSMHKVSFMAFFNGAIPLIAGFSIGMLFGFGFTVSALIGIIFISSSVAVVVPTLDRKKIINSPLGHIIVGSTILQDVSSLILISIFLQINDPITGMPLTLFYALVTLLVFVLYKFIRWFRRSFVSKGTFDEEFQFILFILIGVVVLFSVIGLHHIIAGFFAGFVLSESLQNRKLKDSLHTAGYGIFIPIFFVFVGANTDISSFANLGSVIILTSVIVGGLLVSKFASGYAAARYENFDRQSSLLIASTSLPQLATTLAVIYTAFNEGIIESDLVTAFVILSIVTTIISPTLTQIILKRKSPASEAPAS